MIGRKIFSDTKQPNGLYSSGFELVIRLDDNAEEYGFQQLQIQLPLNDSGHVKKGRYSIENSVVKDGGLIDLIYTKGMFTDVFPDAAFNADKEKFNFNISIRIEEFDAINHSISGVIDSMKIYSIADTSKKIRIKNAGFNFYFDFLEVYLNDTLTYETATTAYSIWYPRNFGGEENISSVSGERLYPVVNNVPIKQGQVTFGFSFMEVLPVFQQETVLPLTPSSTTVFLIGSQEYVEIGSKPLYGITPVAGYQCRFINSTQVNIAGGVEITTTSAKALLDEYYDYNVDPVAYYPQGFLATPEYKLKCAFYQRKL